MIRADIIATIGRKYLTSNIENDEFSYPKAYKELNLEFNPITNSKGRKFEKLDVRFVKDNVTVLIETKNNFSKNLEAYKEQLSAYVEYEKALTNNKIVSILSNSQDENVLVWRGAISERNFMENEIAIRSMDEYVDFYTNKINDKEKVMKNTYALNETLHDCGIDATIRSQFVGTCLLALKNGLIYKDAGITASMMKASIKDALASLLEKDLNKATKIALLNSNVLENQSVRELETEDFRKVLKEIDENILPYINDKSTAGQDLLNLFFISFNKYIGKKDKNQAFTPDHITDFMAKICKVNKNSIILDPCCGSGAFLVRAMTMALDDCATASEQETVKKEQIHGIEYDENVFALATTNMLIHSDGNSNVFRGSCFSFKDKIKEAKPTIVLMNPPYNAAKKFVPKSFAKTWGKSSTDPSKGFYFLKFILDTLNSAKIKTTVACLLPVACAIGTSEIIAKMKKAVLKHNTLDAVFTLPNELFYPGASANACCMIFKTGEKHKDAGETFFGYYKDDGFRKKKNLGRIEQIDSESGISKWEEIENNWLTLYVNRLSVDGLSVTHKVTGEDEWLCEAYMKTDYRKLSESDFQQTLNNYLAYLMKEGKIYES